MWMQSTPLEDFTNWDGTKAQIKIMRDIPAYSRFYEIELGEGSMLDEIASRTNVYGEGAEGQSYKLLEANVVAMFENDFDLSRLKRLRIPV